MSKGFVAAEQGHVVQLLAPVDVAAAATSDTISMENWAHVSIIVGNGVGSSTTITVGECTGFGGTGRTAVTFRSAQEQGILGGDVLDAALAYASSVTMTGSAAAIGGFLVIEIDADELSDGSHFLQVNTDGAGASKLTAMYAILSGGRFQEDITATVIA